MEQYAIPVSIYYSTIKKVLKRFAAERVFVRFVGSLGGKTVLYEELKGKKFDVRQTKNGLQIMINNEEKFLYKTESVNKTAINGKRWLIAYERRDKDGIYHVASTGYPNLQEPQYTGPDDPRLPNVQKSILRSVNDQYLIEITFEGKIPLKKSYRQSKELQYWPHWTLKE